jgi:hypothetical protein
MSMNNEAFKAWLDAMPIDDVRRKIERLETKLADLRVLDRIYSERHEGAAEQPESLAQLPEGENEQTEQAEGENEHAAQPEGETGGEAKPDWQEPS